MGALMRGAAIGMAAGLLTSIGLGALFGGGRQMESSDLVAAGLGTASTIGTAFLYRNPHLIRRRSPMAIRHPITYPRRPILLAMVGALGGLMINSMRIENRIQNEEAQVQTQIGGQPGYNQYGDPIPPESA
jgi:hypothetical protein